MPCGKHLSVGDFELQPAPASGQGGGRGASCCHLAGGHEASNSAAKPGDAGGARPCAVISVCLSSWRAVPRHTMAQLVPWGWIEPGCNLPCPLLL